MGKPEAKKLVDDTADSAELQATSLLFNGTLMHHRLKPVVHKFEYPACFFAFDVQELEKADSESGIFSYNKRSIVSIYDSDYLGSELPGSIYEKALSAIPDKNLTGKVSKIVLITSPRFLGYVFNPVNFYYYLDSAGGAVGFLAEVNNTFSEKHIYFVEPGTESKSERLTYCRHKKEFYVSPFFKPEGFYRFYFGPLGDNLEIRVDLVQNDELVFTSNLKGQAKDFNSRSLRRSLAEYPVLSSLNFPRILVQAALLYFKKNLPVYQKPSPFHDNTRQYKPTLAQRLSRTLFEQILQRLKVGQLELIYPEGSSKNFDKSGVGPNAALRVRDNRFFTKVLTGGDIGFGEAVSDGLVESGNMVEFLRLAVRNQELMEGDTAVSGPKKMLSRLSHFLKSNSPARSKKNISTHYDLSNEFFGLFLDKSMTYSSAVFESELSSLEEAQARKIEKIVRKLLPGENNSRKLKVLEIGCGWGSTANEILRGTNCSYQGITLSKEQLRYCLENLATFVQEGRSQFELRDYRNVEGEFDRIVSVEMIEAVGKEYLQEYFCCLDRLLTRDGKAVIQAITIADERYEEYSRGCDWIQRYIFPGGHLPSLEVIDRCLGETKLEIVSKESIGLDYARTLSSWRERFDSRLDEVRELGFDEKFIRMWRYYFDYCEAGFKEKTIDCFQIVLDKR